VFDPPPGHADLDADALAAPSQPVSWERLTVDDEVGDVLATPPRPAALAALARATRAGLSDEERLAGMVEFLRAHMPAAEFERLLMEQMMDRMPVNVMDRVIRAVTTWGTGRPYQAVLVLTAHTAAQWREVRTKLLLAGVADPMGLASMHRILDVTEHMVVEVLVSVPDAETRLASWRRGLYGPVAGEVPAGFSAEEVEDSFDAFARAAHGGTVP